MNLCRACLSSDKELFPSDDSFACNYNLLTNINVKYSDGKSQSFCQNCVEAVNCFIEFRNKCLSAEQTLLGIVEQALKTESQLPQGIKTEIKCENEDFASDIYFDDVLHESAEIKKEECSVHIKKERPSRQCKIKKTKYVKKKDYSNILAGASAHETSGVPTCGLCGDEFKDAGTLRKHIGKHEIIQGCKFCPATFTSRAQMFAHRLLHTAHCQACHLCGIKFKSHTNLEFHYRNIHDRDKSDPLKCEKCDKTFITARKLRKHMWSLHSDKEFTCDICSKMFNNKTNLKTHVRSHSDVKPYVCDLCGYSSKYSSGLTAHNIRRHAPTKCICKVCGNAFKDAEKLARHSCTDTSQICPVCGKCVKRGLIRHMRAHSSECRYKCERCPAAYKSRSALKVHRDKHDNNPTQQCEYCQARFYSGSVLIKHRRIHTGEKPYACTKCDMRFTGGHNLKLHMKVHGENLINKRNKEPTDC
ncbi:zinc finger protein 43-like [Leguminivora glycinivorella]|uniref:zinc finger protein 43-like n=1 Tax=Leguminivora glycinivorella TaxID=1035111 RepID=UPI00200C708B|nr:zinc finger protein 43-like [Leguminivora glycinivorella]